MGRKSQTRDFGDGLVVTVSQLPATRAFKLFPRLVKVLGPAGKMLAGAAGGGLARMDVSEFFDGLTGVAERLPPDVLLSLTQEILATAELTKNGRKGELLPMIDTAFQGRIKDLFRVIAFALEVNYGDFLDGWRSTPATSDEATETDQASDSQES